MKGVNMDGVVTLTAQDDEALFMAASGLANIADDLDNGVEIPNLSQVLRVAAMLISGVMANAHGRVEDVEFNLN